MKTFGAWMEDDITLRVSIAGGEDGSILVASMNLRVGDWAVYRGWSGDPREVGRVGDKLGAEEAAVVFPMFAKGFRYRP